MKKDNLVYLHLISDCIAKVDNYSDGMDFVGFTEDNKTQSAIIMQLHVIGELSKKVPPEITQEIDIEWKKIAGLRDFISHEYFSLGLDTIWKTVSDDLPKVKQEIEKYLKIK